MVIEAGLHLAHELAEAQHYADFIRLDFEKAGKAPQRHDRQRDQRNAAAAEIARQQGAQPVLAAAQEFFEVGRLGPLRLRPRAPRSTRSRTPRAPGLVAPRHYDTPRPRRHSPAWLAGYIGERPAPYNAQLCRAWRTHCRRFCAFVDHEGERGFVRGGGLVLFAPSFAPELRIDDRKTPIAVDGFVNLGDDKARRRRQHLRINVGAAGDDDGIGAPPQSVAARGRQGGVEARRDDDARRGEGSGRG